MIASLGVAVLAPVGLIIYQSFLDGPFFMEGTRIGLDAYEYILTDLDFCRALWTTTLFAVGMVAVAVPGRGGGAQDHVAARPDQPGGRRRKGEGAAHPALAAPSACWNR